MPKCGIYVIENMVSPLFYIGQTHNMQVRWNGHKSLLRHGGKTNRRLLFSWGAHGEEAFRFSVLEECASDLLTEREAHWLGVYRERHPGAVANSAGPVDNPTKGVPMSAERKARMSKDRTGKPNPHIVGENNPAKRPEVRAARSGAGNPAKRPEVRQKMSDARSNWVEDSNSGERWRTMSDCAAELGISVAAVSRAVAIGGKCGGRTIQRVFNKRIHRFAEKVAA